jgi:hypothetical protein
MSILDKEKEIKDFCIARLQEIADYQDHPEDFRESDVYDLAHEIFNSDYYIVGRYQAKKWIGADAFDCIAEIQDYEQVHLGESHTDFSEPERVVNMYVYVVGERIIQECFDEVCEHYLTNQAKLQFDVSC